MSCYEEIKRVFVGDPVPEKPPFVPPPPLDVRAVITCVNYADFLAYTLPTNKHLLNDIVVVTTPADTATQRVCTFWEVRCLTTNAFTEGGSFCKARGINAGICSLGADADWLLHMDADILLPPRAKWLMELARPDPSCVFGVDRLNVRSFGDWASFLASPSPQHQLRTYCHHGAFPTGSRIVREDEGWMPIGYFQLWNPKGSGVTTYPATAATAARDDTLFAMQWPRCKRVFIPEFLVYHLESAPAEQGANWKGRTTPYFGPATQPPAEGLKP